MKPYKILKSARPLARHVVLRNRLKAPRIPLRFFRTHWRPPRTRFAD